MWESDVQWTNAIPVLLISVHNQHTVRMPSTELCRGMQGCEEKQGNRAYDFFLFIYLRLHVSNSALFRWLHCGTDPLTLQCALEAGVFWRPHARSWCCGQCFTCILLSCLAPMIPASFHLCDFQPLSSLFIDQSTFATACLAFIVFFSLESCVDPSTAFGRWRP